MSLLNSGWYDCYGRASLKNRRLKTHRKKIKRTGILNAPKDARILDVCCGQGEMLDLLRDEGFLNLTGVDVMPKEQLESLTQHPGWTYLESDATRLPFEKESFDWILCMHALHHLAGPENIEIFLSRAVELLKPGGNLCVVDHFDSPLLRSIFGLIESPLGNLFPWTRSFRVQLREEHADIWGYLNQWPQVKAKVQAERFSGSLYEEKLFFFYFKFRKRD